ncbi:hypothetical protein R0J90_11945, partial [Micrococcus sp. SIMBA_144]
MSKIVFTEDLPKKRKINENNLKHIPEEILEQLKGILSSNPSHLSPVMTNKELEYVPIVILLMATGWRISDILNLKYNNCLVTV